MLLIITIIITTSNFIKCCTFAATNRTSNDGADIGDGDADDSDKVHWPTSEVNNNNHDNYNNNCHYNCN